MRTLAIAIALLVAAPLAQAKKHHRPAHAKVNKHAKRGKTLVRVEKSRPTRVAAAETRLPSAPAVTATSPAPVAAPTPAPAATPPSPPPRGPAVDQAGDDEVPGSRMRR